MIQRTNHLLAVLIIAAMIISACGSDAENSTSETDTAQDPSTTAVTAPTTADVTSTEPANDVGQPAPTSTGSGIGNDFESGLRLVALGDSIPYNSPEDCPGCTGFVDRYADALEAATGRPIEVDNQSQHNGLTLPMLMEELDTFEDDLREADAIVVGIAHNSIALNEDHPCGTNWIDTSNTFDDWSKLTADCATNSAENYRAMYEELFSTIATWREGEPTVLLTINRYSDWLGWTDADLAPEQEATTVTFLDTWNSMLCDAATSNGFTCIDIYHAFNGPDGSKSSGDLLAADYTHPSATGNELIAQLLSEAGFATLV